MWIKIQAFNKIELLSKASYLMLLFVPILAGLWPAVKNGINQYNRILTSSIDSLNSASERLSRLALSSSIDDSNSKKIQDTIDSLNKNISEKVEVS